MNLHLRRALGLLLPCALAACGSTSEKASLTSVTDSTGDAKCAAGGKIISVGVDKNGNGTLDPDEITATAEVCVGNAGTTGAAGGMGDVGVAFLTATTTLNPGDVNCGRGGTRLDYGFDNGAGGSTAGDGKLQAGEIVGTQYICNQTLPLYVGSTTPPAAPAGAFKLVSSGGNGAAGNGGNAGAITASYSNGSLGGHVKIFKTGIADASFTLPTYTFTAGSQPLVVNADLALNTYADTTTGLASADNYFQVVNDRNLYARVAAAAVPVTSISITAGKTLTLSLNFAAAPPGTGEPAGAIVNLANDFKNDGKLTSARLVDGKSATGISINCPAFYGSAASSIDLTGTAQVGAAGGNGGPLWIFTKAHLVNQGPINTSGGNGDAGGNAGTLALNHFNVFNTDFYNTGALTAKGGTGAVTTGGAGGNIDIESGYLPFQNSGATDSSGGNGITGAGAAGTQFLSCWYVGGGKSSGTITAKGGTCSLASCNGGSGGGVQFEVWNGPTIVTSPIDTSGGDGQGAGIGGNGGIVVIVGLDQDGGEFGGPPIPGGSVTISSNITTRGGNGGFGGNGGGVTLQVEAAFVPEGQELILLGYTDFIANGGTGSVNGGNGGNMTIANAVSIINGSLALTGPGGATMCYANLSSKGGDGGTGTGGKGGTLAVRTQITTNFGSSFEVAQMFGDTVDIRGGAAAGALAAGAGGAYTLTGIGGVENHATILGGGGANSGTGAGNGNGAATVTSAYGTAANTGTIDVSGGASAAEAGGNGGSVRVAGTTTTNSAALNSKGGNGITTGGNGGTVQLVSAPGKTSNTGTLTVTAGTGTPAGTKGAATIDGENVAP